jgi:protein phosphatase
LAPHGVSVGEIVIRSGRPSLVVLIGAAGAGKTTLAARLFEPGEVISSDELRAAISGDATDQRATRPAFTILHRDVGRRLAAGRLVVVDATSVEAAARRSLLRVAAAAGAEATAILLALPPDVVRARNAARQARPVAPEIVDRHLGRVARLMANGSGAARAVLLAEGFGDVHIVQTDIEVTRLRVVRRPSARP